MGEDTDHSVDKFNELIEEYGYGKGITSELAKRILKENAFYLGLELRMEPTEGYCIIRLPESEEAGWRLLTNDDGETWRFKTEEEALKHVEDEGLWSDYEDEEIKFLKRKLILRWDGYEFYSGGRVGAGSGKDPLDLEMKADELRESIVKRRLSSMKAKISKFKKEKTGGFPEIGRRGHPNDIVKLIEDRRKHELAQHFDRLEDNWDGGVLVSDDVIEGPADWPEFTTVEIPKDPRHHELLSYIDALLSKTGTLAKILAVSWKRYVNRSPKTCEACGKDQEIYSDAQMDEGGRRKPVSGGDGVIGVKQDDLFEEVLNRMCEMDFTMQPIFGDDDYCVGSISLGGASDYLMNNIIDDFAGLTLKELPPEFLGKAPPLLDQSELASTAARWLKGQHDAVLFRYDPELYNGTEEEQADIAEQLLPGIHIFTVHDIIQAAMAGEDEQETG